MTLQHTTRYFNCRFYYYKSVSAELIFKETRLINEIFKNKFPSKITLLESWSNHSLSITKNFSSGAVRQIFQVLSCGAKLKQYLVR